MTKQNDESKKSQPAQVREAAGAIGVYIDSVGWASAADLAKFAEERNIDHELLHKAVRLLDRQKNITQRQHEGVNGWESLLGRGTGAKKYGALGPPLQLRMILVTPALGHLSLDGLNFSLDKDDDGRPQFRPAQFRAMLRKAFQVGGLGADEDATERAVSRVFVKFVGCSPVKEYARVIRRPINRQRAAVGELIHEAVPRGATIDWVVAFPTSHFSKDVITRLLDACEQVGFSPAGSGPSGGHHGLFRWDKIERETPA